MERFVVVNDAGEFYTRAGNDKWSGDEALAEPFDDQAYAQAIARAERGMVLPA